MLTIEKKIYVEKKKKKTKTDKKTTNKLCRK